ncbi:hypothetical protein M407DRAFT_243983, partial [Tulasnella calospora MUT 4182]
MLHICSFNSIGKFTELKYPQQNFGRPHDLESSMLGRHITHTPRSCHPIEGIPPCAFLD